MFCENREHIKNPPFFHKKHTFFCNTFIATCINQDIALALANLGVDSTFFSVVPNNSLGKKMCIRDRYRLAEESTTILVFISIYLHSGGRGCRSFSCCLNHYISFSKPLSLIHI